MDETRKNRDFSKGPVWNPERNRWLVEIRYPDGSRLRKRLRREREALRIWSAEQTKIENGTWHEQAPKTVTFETALKQYREYSTVQNRSHDSYVEPALSVWEAHIKASTLLAKIAPALIENVKLRRAQDVAHTTVDKDLAVLKAFFNWCMARSLAVSNPVCRVKFFNEDNSRLRYLTEDEYSRLIQAAKTIVTSPHLAEKIILSVHTGLRRGSLFHLRWDSVDFLNRVVRIPRTKSGRPLALPLNATVLTILQALYTERVPDCPYVFAHVTGRQAGEPVRDVKNAFHTALEIAEIKDFTWHDLRHTFASWLIMKGASLRSVAELLGHRGLRMVMRYAHLSPAYLSAEVGLLDAPATPTPPHTDAPRAEKRARKGQRPRTRDPRRAKVGEFPKGIGSSGWTRTNNPPVNSVTQVVGLAGSSCQ
jgi:integrase